MAHPTRGAAPSSMGCLEAPRSSKRAAARTRVESSRTGVRRAAWAQALLHGPAGSNGRQERAATQRMPGARAVGSARYVTAASPEVHGSQGRAGHTSGLSEGITIVNEQRMAEPALLAAVIDIARQAGALILDIYRTDFEVREIGRAHV